MSKFRDKIDNFLFHFSYSIKIKSIIFLAASTAIFVAVMLIITQHRLLSNVGKQEFGIQYEQELNILLEKILTQKIVTSPTYSLSKNLKAPIKFNEHDVDNQLSIIADYNEKAATLFFAADSAEIEKLRFHHAAIENEWQLIRKGGTSFFLIIEEIRLLTQLVDSIFNLSLNIDPGMHYLNNILIRQIPNMESSGIKLITKKDLFIPYDQKDLEQVAKLIIQKESLNNSLARIEESLAFAKGENITINEGINDPTFQANIAECLNAYKQLMQMVPSNAVPTSPDALIEQGIECLKQSSTLSQNMMNQSLNLLQTQSHTLLLRENYGVGFIIFGVVVVLAAYMTRIIRRPLAGIRHAAEELAHGNMGVRIEVFVNDEVGQICHSFNQLVEQIEKIIKDIDGISSNLATSSKGIFTTAQHLESNVIRQENAITQIASNAKGVSRTVQDFARSLQEVSQSATVTAHLANLGRTSLIEMENIMHQMAKASMSIVTTLSDLQDKIGSINDVINTIILIADQINLLSLNTAIRAGKPGIKHLGFSVVADKISELADQTALATLDIEELVEKIITMVSDSVQIVDNFSDQIRNQVYEATEIGEELKKLITKTQEQFEAFESVNQNMQQQTKRAQQIHESINLLTEVAQNTTHSVRNLYLEIQYLHHSTNNLKLMTKKLTEDKESGYAITT